MEALAAFSLTGTVLEFARFGMSLLSNGRELYKSSQGVLTANQQLELAIAIADLRALLVKLGAQQCPTAAAEDEEDEEDEDNFQHILQGVEKTAKELVERLEGLKVKGTKSRKWQSIRRAIKAAWTKDEIDGLMKKLETFKDAVETRISSWAVNHQNVRI